MSAFNSHCAVATAVSALLLGAAMASSPIAGFRPPAVPILSQSPLINSWSAANNLNGAPITDWTGWNQEMVAIARVDGVSFALMGLLDYLDVSTYQNATQTSVTVYSTQTVYVFQAGPVSIDVTFTSPLLTEDWELLSRPAHYVTFFAAATDGKSHAVQVYFDMSGRIVMNDGTADAAWSRTTVTGVGIDSQVTALSIGAAEQNPLSTTDDSMSWGYLYVLAETDASGAAASMVLEYSNVTRSSFVSGGTIPTNDNPTSPAPLIVPGPTGPGTGPQIGVDRSGYDLPGYPITLNSSDYNLCWALCNTTDACLAWAYAETTGTCGSTPSCWLKGALPQTSSNPCRVSGDKWHYIGPGTSVVAATVFDLGTVTATGTSRFLTIAVDEIVTLDWFGEYCPPYWRRALPVNSTEVPMEMLSVAFSEYEAVLSACNAFDASNAKMLSSVGGDQYATVTQLTYRQVFGGMALVWIPSKSTVWYFLKEISSCGCLNTADVIYPAFPQILYYSPELMKLMIISHLEYAMNYTNQPYPLPWAPHHLGYWPLADLPYTSQENMPLEETAWDLLIIAAIAQRQGGDLTWLAPYWPVIGTWYEFLITLLPFPGLQLSTDDFDGVLYNATNLALKGVASIAAYGYIVEQYTGNQTAAAEAYATAASYAETMVEYAWLDAGSNSHFMIGYAGSQGDGGNATSWPMLYNALWLRILGYDTLLPNQAQLLSTQRDWYVANQMQQFGLPLNSRALFTKDDWMTFLAATYYTNDTVPVPSAFSNMLFSGFFNFANTTTSREPISDWTYTNVATAAGFTARPVFGAMYAPVLVAQAAQLGLGQASDPAVAHANRVFQEVHNNRRN
jgi:hypothetical protein